MTYIREGEHSWGDIIANRDDDYIRVGEHSWGDILMNIDDDYIRKGEHSWGDILFNIDGTASRTEKAALAMAALLLS